jgi:hypothetical protein
VEGEEAECPGVCDGLEELGGGGTDDEERYEENEE